MNLDDLGRRAVACKHWRWMDGSKRMHPNRRWKWMRAAHRWLPIPGYECTLSFQGKVFEESYPDLSDPATLGCLLALVRETWKGNIAPVYPDNDEALVKLVAALEAAP